MWSYQYITQYKDNYFKTSRSLWLFYINEPVLDDYNDIVGFADKNTTDSFKFKEKKTDQTSNNGIKNVEIMVPLRYLINFWKTLEMSLISCKINFMLTWSVNCVI